MALSVLELSILLRDRFVDMRCVSTVTKDCAVEFSH